MLLACFEVSARSAIVISLVALARLYDKQSTPLEGRLYFDVMVISATVYSFLAPSRGGLFTHAPVVHALGGCLLCGCESVAAQVRLVVGL